MTDTARRRAERLDLLAPDHLPACPSCGDLNDPEDKWCDSCGKWLRLVPPNKWLRRGLQSRKGKGF